MTDTAFPICDWQLNANYGALAQAMLGRIPLMINPSLDLDPLLQMDGLWTIFDEESGWRLMADDALYGPLYEPKMPAAAAVCGNRILFVYPGGILVMLDPNGNFVAGKIHD